MKYDFSGWVTRNNLRCSDGRVIMHDAFKANDGAKVPLVWNHQHNDPDNVLGTMLLENRDDGVYGFGSFNDTPKAAHAKLCVQHGDINALSIFANQLKQNGNMVEHGNIREVSLVLAGANPGAYIESVIAHGEEVSDMAVIYNGTELDPNSGDTLKHADSPEVNKNKKPAEDETVADVFNTLSEKQKTVVYAIIGQAIEDATSAKHSDDDDNNDDNDEGGNLMHTNIFERGQDSGKGNVYLAHADEENIIRDAKSSGNTFRNALSSYLISHGFVDENEYLAHGFDEIETLFPDPRDLRPGAPEIIEPNDDWVSHVMQRVHKSPFSRIKTRQADVEAIRAGGYKTKGSKKAEMGNASFSGRSTDPQTIFIKAKLDRDDIIDITDFDVVNYQYGIMDRALREEIATAILIGDGRDPDDEQKIQDIHVRPIWLDDENYTIHTLVDVAAAKAELQGTNTGANFGENYIYAEAIITAALYAREQYKGSGALEFYCTPHLLNVMLLAKDMNGRRIYSSKADLTAALNVTAIHTVEQFAGKSRKDLEHGSVTKNLLGIFVNLADYNVGSVRGGEITRFTDFDIDFNQQKYLIETRMSGALTRVKSAIVLEEVASEDAKVSLDDTVN